MIRTLRSRFVACVLFAGVWAALGAYGPSHAAAQQDAAPPAPTLYRMHSLAPSGGELQGHAHRVKDNLAVTGFVFSSGEDRRAFYWTPEAGLQTPEIGGGSSEGWDINAAGWMTGSYGTQGTNSAFIWSADTGPLFSTMGTHHAGAWQMNDYGQIVGWSAFSGAPSRAFLWQPEEPGATEGVAVDLGTLGGTSAEAFAINSHGQIAGKAAAITGRVAVMLWNPFEPNSHAGEMFDLGPLGVTGAEARDINDRGHLAGRMPLPEGGSTPIVWTPNTPNGSEGTWYDLRDTGEVDSGRADGINIHGQVVGGSAPDGPFIWDPENGIRFLHDMLEPSSNGLVLSVVRDINDGGWITGRANSEEDTNLRYPVLLQPLFGDLNGTGSVDAVDVQLIVNGVLQAIEPTAAFDLNGDGDVNAVDIQLLIIEVLGVWPGQGAR